MTNNSFTFWENMKDTIDIYTDIEQKYKLYDALTEYGLYGVQPEDDGTKESQDLISFVQSMVPSLDKSRNYKNVVAESGAAGGRKQKVTDEQIERAIKEATLKKSAIPTRAEVVNALFDLEKVKVDAKTISRRFPDDRKKEIAVKVLEGHKDKINVPEGQDMSQGQNGDKINVPGTLGTLGQNGDKIDVPEDINNVSTVFEF